MKDFFKFTFASMLGVVLAGIVFTILGIVSMVGMVASSDTETVVQENSVFVLDLNGTLSERVQENPLQSLNLSLSPNTWLRGRTCRARRRLQNLL